MECEGCVQLEEMNANLKRIREELEDLRKEFCLQLADLNGVLRRIALLHAALLLALLLLLLK
jgi:ABC-type Zn uptake system ZnuABC Zn-binding protein ZnuA